MYSEFATEAKPRQSVNGLIRNVASGGLGITTDSSLSPGTVVRCEITVQDSSIKIPTLLKVCWSKRFETKGKFELGLTYLL